MSSFKPMTPEWQQWCRDNLARGCDEATLIAAMVQAGIEPVTAGIAVLQAMNQPTQASTGNAANPAAYEYTAARFPQVGSRIQTHDREVKISFRLLEPVVTVVDDFMSMAECEQLVEMSRAKLQRSTIVDPSTGAHQHIAERTSSGTFFALNEDAFIARLDRRIADLMHWPIENGEGLQILNYLVGGEYKSHFDYFPPSDPGCAMHIAKGGQRVSTLIIYLNDVPAGGETTFPSVGLSVVPKKGSAVYFEYCNAHGQLDERTLHGGLPVLAGEKWIATKWMRQRKYA